MKTWTKHEVDRNDQYDILYITNDSGEYEMTLTSYNNGWGYPCLTYYCPEKIIIGIMIGGYLADSTTFLKEL